MDSFVQMTMFENLPNDRETSPSNPIEDLGLSKRTFNALKRSGINSVEHLVELINSGAILTVRGLGNLSSCEIEAVLSERGLLIPKALDELELVEDVVPSPDVNTQRIIYLSTLSVEKLIAAEMLHNKARLMGKSVGHWLDERDEPDRLLSWIAIATAQASSINIVEELSYLLKEMSRDHIEMFVLRYGIEHETLNEIGGRFGISRERVRQICVKLVKQLKPRVNVIMTDCQLDDFSKIGAFFLKTQTALYLAEDMGEDITFSDWKAKLKSSGLLGFWPYHELGDYDPIEALVAILNCAEEEEIAFFKMPNNLLDAIELASAGTPELPAKILSIGRSLSKNLRRTIKRHTRFSGGVDVLWLSHETGEEVLYLHDVMESLGYRKLSEKWYVPRVKSYTYQINKHDVFHHALRKMFLYCGPLPIDSICSGIRHAISRTDYPAPPEDVLEKMLETFRYEKEDNLYYWDGAIEEELSSGEKILIECIKQNGPVVHHAQLAQAIIDSDLSFPSLHATLKRTTLIEKVDPALYRLRGKSVSHDDIEQARNVSERTAANVTINFDRQGNIIVQATIGMLVTGTGVLYSENLPNLSGEWASFVGEKKAGTLRATEREFRNLAKPLSMLACRGGDRLQFTFNTWDRTVQIEKSRSDHEN